MKHIRSRVKRKMWWGIWANCITLGYYLLVARCFPSRHIR